MELGLRLELLFLERGIVLTLFQLLLRHEAAGEELGDAPEIGALELQSLLCGLRDGRTGVRPVTCTR